MYPGECFICGSFAVCDHRELEIVKAALLTTAAAEPERKPLASETPEKAKAASA